MVQADVAGEPLQHLRQFVVGTPLQRGRRFVPFPVVRPVDVLVLVLDVEHPYPQRRRDDHDGELHQKVGLQTDGQAGDHDDGENREVCDVDAELLLFSRRFGGKAMCHQEHKPRTNAEGEEWKAHQAIGDARPHRCIPVLLNGHRPHVTDAAAIQIARGGMVNHVGMSPILVGRKRQHAEDVADNRVRLLGREERTVGTVVEKDEDADHKPGSGHGQQQRQPIGVAQLDTADHQDPHSHIE